MPATLRLPGQLTPIMSHLDQCRMPCHPLLLPLISWEPTEYRLFNIFRRQHSATFNQGIPKTMFASSFGSRRTIPTRYPQRRLSRSFPQLHHITVSVDCLDYQSQQQHHQCDLSHQEQPLSLPNCNTSTNSDRRSHLSHCMLTQSSRFACLLKNSSHIPWINVILCRQTWRLPATPSVEAPPFLRWMCL